jgi:hypothetical protein
MEPVIYLMGWRATAALCILERSGVDAAIAYLKQFKRSNKHWPEAQEKHWIDAFFVRGRDLLGVSIAHNVIALYRCNYN